VHAVAIAIRSRRDDAHGRATAGARPPSGGKRLAPDERTRVAYYRALTDRPRREQGQGAVAPLARCGGISRLTCDASATAVAGTRNPLTGPMLTSAGRTQDGRRFVPPAKRPAQVSQQGRGVSDPASASQTSPRNRPAGSLTPHMSVSTTYWGACAKCGSNPIANAEHFRRNGSKE
jgi:hypothetical protein